MKPIMLSNVIQVLQLGTLIVGLVVVSANIGAKGETLNQHTNELRELRSISQDLVKSQISTAKDAEMLGKQYQTLEARVNSLQSHKP